MRKQQWLALGSLMGGLSLVLALTTPVHSQKPAEKPSDKRPPAEETLPQRLAKGAKLTEEQATKFFNAFGPAVREELTRGNTVSVPGLGTFRVVRVEEHRDLQNGRPVVVPAKNTIEFLAGDELAGAANSAKARPAETVPPFQYVPLPGQTPGQKTPRTRVPPTRVP